MRERLAGAYRVRAEPATPSFPGDGAGRSLELPSEASRAEADPAPASDRWSSLAALTDEALAIARQGRLLCLPRRRRTTARGERTVVFVHGFGAGGPVFDPLRTAVETRLPTRETIDFSYRWTDAFASVSQALAERIARLAREGRRVDLVGHSLGGLVARWVVQELDGAPHVDRLITLATPHAGTASARLAPGPLRNALAPGGTIVRRLAVGRDRAASVRHVSFVAGADLLVTPPASAAAIRDATIRWFDRVGHNAMLFDRAVHDAVIEALDA